MIEKVWPHARPVPQDSCIYLSDDGECELGHDTCDDCPDRWTIRDERGAQADHEQHDRPSRIDCAKCPTRACERKP